jgi:large subunit ribosomal protein L10
MNPVKQVLVKDLNERLKSSPFLIVVDYTKTTVPEFNTVRKRLAEIGATLFVAKNTQVRIAAKEAGLSEDIAKSLLGQTAIVTGAEDVAAAAKILKTFATEAKKLPMKGGIVDGNFVDDNVLGQLASIPTKPQLQSMLLRTFKEPAASLARVLQAFVDKQNEGSAPAPVAEAEAAPAAEAPAAEAPTAE